MGRRESGEGAGKGQDTHAEMGRDGGRETGDAETAETERSTRRWRERKAEKSGA